jgi:uncharacterized protein (DUF608 family)
MKNRRIPYTKEELYDRSPQLTYTGRNLDEIAFPLGGIGTGMVSLGGWGQLRDWEIMNHPDKGNSIPEAFFTLKVKRKDGTAVTRLLRGPVGGSYSGSGHSLSRWMGDGLPHFRNVTFTGCFPFATVNLADPDMPVKVVLEAFNPFIPLNDKDSSIPAAILIYRIKNTTDEKLSLFLCGNLTNVVGGSEPEGHVNEEKKQSGLTGLFMTSTRCKPDSPRHGSLVLAAPGAGASVWPRWHGGPGSVSEAKFWEAVARGDEFPPKIDNPTGDTGSVGVSIDLKEGGSVSIPFFICWYFPVFEQWKKGEGCEGETCGKTWKNYYASLWKDAWDVAVYVAKNFNRLEGETRLFHDTFFSSTLPSHVLDAVSSQISILKTPTCLRLPDGTFYGFEGCSNTAGCCEGSCTHVWNYAQALPYLFPRLQRSMLEAHFENSMREDGFIQFRMPLPPGTKAETAFHPAADGQMGIVMQVYREWLISGDRSWLEKIWPAVKKALEFAWKYWDADKDGVMEGMQHNTYDIEFHGPNTMMGSLYLGALKAGEKLAHIMGEEDRASKYRRLFEKGSDWMDKNLFNGEYYEQKVAKGAEKPWPDNLRELAERHGRDDRFDWPRWQYGKGCISDQLIGQWYGRMLGLGNFYSLKNIRKALASIFRCNWKSDLSNHPCPQRIYAVNDEAGLLIGTWPRGERPGFAFFYADEVWCGIEYQVASHLIYEGFIDEGLAIVLGLRKRYRGDRRNPWDEFECGHHYARSMASYSLMTALSGFSYSAPEESIGFNPKVFFDDFRCFFSVESGWGMLSRKNQGSSVELCIKVEYGSLILSRLAAGLKISTGLKKAKAPKCNLNGKVLPCRWNAHDSSVLFDEAVKIKRGQRLSVVLGE